MKKIAIRINFSNKIVLGHIFRMKILAEQISKKTRSFLFPI
jgi:spore coat polysaccharide biosynthesis predicted glycosyltransferase SpsG